MVNNDFHLRTIKGAALEQVTRDARKLGSLTRAAKVLENSIPRPKITSKSRRVSIAEHEDYICILTSTELIYLQTRTER